MNFAASDTLPPPAAEQPAAGDPIEVRHSAIHGLGVFARCHLPADEPIGVYEGRRYTEDEAAQRDWDAGITYVFGLSDGGLIDGAEGGNATRHLNHACRPNCAAYETEGEDGRLQVVIHTLRDIEPGEELLLDYALDTAGADPAAFPCRCGSENCRGTMAAMDEAAAG